MPNPHTDTEKRQFAAAYLNSGDAAAAYRYIRPQTKSDSAADKGGRRMLAHKDVQAIIADIKAKQAQAINAVNGQLLVMSPENEQIHRTIGMSEIQLINEYIATAMLDHLNYYKDGNPIPLEDLAPELRRQIAEIEWEPGPGGTRRVRDYVLEDRSKARDQLGKIMGIVNPAFDFAGLLALLTGKKKDEAAEEIRRLNHSEGVNWESIQKKAGVLIDNKTGEVMP